MSRTDHDRYQNYDPFPGIIHQLCAAHLLRDLADAAETYPGCHLAGPDRRCPARAYPRRQPGALIGRMLIPPIILPDASFVLHVAKHRAWPAFAVTAGGHFR